ncbi:MAG: hypothetical protein K2V38_12525, partial [Gemmataceae bacterium]|nr:hypothetical protein [Gemmataceae bacterium]
MVTGSSRGRPVHRLSLLAIGLAVLAGLLALYGGGYAEKHIAGSPLRAARGDDPPLRPVTRVGRAIDAGERRVFGGET